MVYCSCSKKMQKKAGTLRAICRDVPWRVSTGRTTKTPPTRTTKSAGWGWCGGGMVGAISVREE